MSCPWYAAIFDFDRQAENNYTMFIFRFAEETFLFLIHKYKKWWTININLGVTWKKVTNKLRF